VALASGSTAAIAGAAAQATNTAVAAGISREEATAGFNTRVSELLASGASPAAALAEATQAMQQMADATTRTGPATPAQAVSDAFSNPSSAPGNAAGAGTAPTVATMAANAAMAAALASGASPEQAMRDATVASNTILAMQTLATTPIPPGGELAASLGAGSIPSGPAETPAAAFASSYATALGLGLDPKQAQTAAETAARTRAAMDATANLPPTEAQNVARSLASGDLQAVASALMASSGRTDGDGGAGSAALQELSAAMAAGRPLEQALAIALRAGATEQDQKTRGMVEVSAADARIADLAAGRMSDSCALGCEAERVAAQQLAAASVPVANPDLAELAQGRILSTTTASLALRRLLGAPALDLPGDKSAGGGEADDPLARLIAHLAQGTGTDADFLAWTDVSDSRIFATRLLAALKTGRAPADALREARAAVAGQTRDVARVAADATTLPPPPDTGAQPAKNMSGLAPASPNRNTTKP
jgi:hypothetical protein